MSRVEWLEVCGDGEVVGGVGSIRKRGGRCVRCVGKSGEIFKCKVVGEYEDIILKS